MSPQADYVVSNGTGAAVRSDINGQLAAIVTQNSGATEPATMYAYMWWADTTTGLLKLRNGANNAWIVLRELDGTLTIEDGTASSPGLAFADDLNTGVFSPGADQVAFTAGGTARLTATTTGITSALPVDVPLGSASAPTVTFTGDLNTGIYSPGADQVAVATNGTGRLFVNSTGLVGIGSSSPANVLELAGNNSAGNGIGNVQGILRVNNNTTAFGSLPTAGIVFATKYRTSPDIPLDGAAIYGGKENASDANKSFFLAFATRAESGNNGNEAMRIDSQGRLGIGTTSPDAALEVFGVPNANYGNATLFDSTSAAANVGGVLAIGGYKTAQTAKALFGFIKGGKENATSGNESGYLAFGTNNNSSNSEKARIDSSGRLLVGTSTSNGSFDSSIQIAGNASLGTLLVSRFNNNGGGPVLYLAKSRSGTVGTNTIVQSGDELGTVSFLGANGSGYDAGASIQAFVDGTPGASNDMPTRLVFSTCGDGASSPTERMRIRNSGEVLIGQTTTLGVGIALQVLNNATDWVSYFSNAQSSTPYGIQVHYNAAAPNGAGNEFLYLRDNVAARAIIRSNGGLANYSANNANLSDRNAKKDISPAADTWDCIKEWEIVNYRYKDQPDDADLNLGVIAQQVAESCPEVITVFQEAKEATEDQPAQEERLGVKEQQMYWMAIKALQEAQVRIEQLEAKVAALESA
jgi:hypothetical protein